MLKEETTYHVPVLLWECLEGLEIMPDGVYVDVTFGGGGHSREILKCLKGGKLYGFDQDKDAETNAFNGLSDLNDLKDSKDPKDSNDPKDSKAPKDLKDLKDPKDANDPKFIFVASNFRYLKNWMRYYGEVDAGDESPNVDGILADLGVSSHHLDDESRGFSFRFDSPIDMRMNKRAGKTAADILNEYDEERLANILYIYGEIKQSRKLASMIVKQRQATPYKMTGDLVKTCEQCLPKERSKKEMAKVFQALRIEVNHEMDALKEMLEAAIKVLKPGGRLAVITYHSLEDRIVKNFIKAGNAEGKLKQDIFGRVEAPLKTVNKKPILPTTEEQERNPRSRSAKLRIAEKANG